MAAMNHQQVTDMPRRPYQSRQWVFNCPVCHQWQPVASRELQQVCKDAGACPDCVRNDYWVLRMRIVAIEIHLEQLAKAGAAAPEERKPFLRGVYQRKLEVLARAKAQLAALPITSPVGNPLLPRSEVIGKGEK